MELILHLFPYKYMEYEKVLLNREIELLLPNAECHQQGRDIYVTSGEDYSPSCIERLTYVESYTIGNLTYKTIQGRLESGDSEKHKNKQFTRYSTNGLHEYKGKFNPQIVHGIINLLGVKKGDVVVDPFCGSGTTMLECAHLGIESFGIDINPFAVFLSNAKLASLKINTENVKKQADRIVKSLADGNYEEEIIPSDSRGVYLQHWIPENTLLKLEHIRRLTSEFENESKQFFTIVASDLIRDYSNQEPKDLRIRKRISPFPEIPFEVCFEKNIEKYLHRIELVQNEVDIQTDNKAYLADLRNMDSATVPTANMAITSPPYATALPYIDTQRLSLVWTGLISSDEIRSLEAELIGSREFQGQEKKELEKALSINSSDLPAVVYTLVSNMKEALSEKDGFRKQAVPRLMYRYFADMKTSFAAAHSLITDKGSYALVVGHNKTKLGEGTFHIDTPYLLTVLAEMEGWKTKEIMPLQTYKRYGINAKNAINQESLIILERN